jgi:hypothetical protein
MSNGKGALRRALFSWMLFAAAVPVMAASALFTKGTGDVQSQVSTDADGAVVLFTLPVPGQEPRPLATVSQASTGGRARISIAWFERTREAELDLVGLEHLYEYVLQQDPAGLYEFVRFSFGKAGRPSKVGPMQGDVLKAIALARERAIAGLAASGSPLKPIPWSVVSIEASVAADPDVIRVRVLDGRGRPIAGPAVTVSRGQETVCPARLEADGRGSCKLVDAHAHDSGDEGEAAQPVIVTFPGVVSAERIDLPTTLLVSPKK